MTIKKLSGYFDYAAASPLSSSAKKSMEPFLNGDFYNPSSIYLKGREVRLAKEAFRAQIARALGSRPSEIVFTAGGTEANNLAIKGIMNSFDRRVNLVTTAIEHDSILRPAENYNYKLATVDGRGLINVEQLSKLIDNQTILISVGYVNNEIGSIQPIKQLAELVTSIRQKRQKEKNPLPLYLHTDACQAVNYLDISVARLGVDMMSINSGKIYGPKQVGALYVKAGIRLKPLIEGGGQENGLRSGTENVAAIAGFSTALELAVKKHQAESKRLIKIRDQSVKFLLDNVSNSAINGPTSSKRVANNINLTIKGIDNEYFLMQLDELGFQVATGSACSASNEEASHVLKAIGKTESDARSTIRITMGKYTEEADIKSLVQAIVQLSC